MEMDLRAHTPVGETKLSTLEWKDLEKDLRLLPRGLKRNVPEDRKKLAIDLADLT